MTQAWNLSQLANKVNTSGQLDVSTGASGALPIANGGTNNGALAVTAGGVVYTDGSKLVNVGAGTSGQVLTSAGASAPTWGTLSASGALNNIQYFTTAGTSTYTPTGGTNFVIVEVIGGGGGSKSGGGSAAGTGGTSSFGSLASATGGGGGTTVGAGSSGDLNLSGTQGGSMGGTSTSLGNINFIGGSAGFGCGSFGSGATINGAPSTTQSITAGGGAGYSRKKITSAFSGVTITVGASGTAGGGGTAGNGGLVIVYEYK